MIAPIATYMPAAKNNDKGISIKSKSVRDFGANDEGLLLYNAGDSRVKGAFLREVAIDPEYNERLGRSLEEPGGKPATTFPSVEEGRKSTKNYTPNPTLIYKRAANSNMKDSNATQSELYREQYNQPYQQGYFAKEKEALDTQPEYGKIISVAAAVEEAAKRNVAIIYGALVHNNKPKTAIPAKTEISRYRLRVQRYDRSPRRYENGSGVSYMAGSLERRLGRKSGSNAGTIDDLFKEAA